MATTDLDIRGDRFLIGGRPVYAEIPASRPEAHGLLMNARFIQGVFDDKADRGRYERFGRGPWDAGRNTEALIGALPQWYRYGLRAFTVGFQGGGPVATIPNHEIDNNPFSPDGNAIDPAYLSRMDRLIRAADELGMAVIVSYFYQGQAPRMADGRCWRNAVVAASRFLREGGYRNVIVEVANEQDVGNFRQRPIVCDQESMALLIDLARRESGGLPVGCSSGGGIAYRQIVDASDVILVHGNGLTRQQYANMVQRVREWSPGKPVVCNEDSHAVGQLAVAFATRSSWGYYNGITKQEPPSDWGVTTGDDLFFARRLADGVGIELPALPDEDQFHLQGLEPRMSWQGRRWIRLACLRPEVVDRVDFYRNGKRFFTCFDEPFMVDWRWNYEQGGTETAAGERWRAVARLVDGREVEREGVVP